MTVGFVGAGRVGLSLADYFSSKGIEVSGFYVGSHTNNVNNKFRLYNGIQDLINCSDILFLTVTDRAIAEVWDGLEHYNIKGKILCHCSGALSSAVFKNCDRYGAYPASIHPILTFETCSVSLSKISDAYFTIEGDNKAVEALSKILEVCENNYIVIDSKNKVKYHSAACFASNFVVAVCQKAVDLLVECGFSKDEAFNALKPMILANAQSIVAKGINNSLTGPIERNDVSTVNRHIEALNDKDSKLYCMLSDILVNISKDIHKDRDYSKMEELI